MKWLSALQGNLVVNAFKSQKWGVLILIKAQCARRHSHLLVIFPGSRRVLISDAILDILPHAMRFRLFK